MSVMRALLTIATLGTLLAGCTLVGDELYPALDDRRPEVVATFPPDGWRQIPVGISPVVWFSEPIEPGSVHAGSLSLVSGDFVQHSRYRVEVESDGRGRVTLEPIEPLLTGVTYSLRIGAELADLAGNALADPQTVSFRTLR